MKQPSPSGQPDNEPIKPSSFEPLRPDSPAATPVNRPTRWWLWGSIAVFVLLLAFLLSARSLQITVIAQTPASVSVSGLAAPFGQRYLLRPGNYEVRATAPGYHPLQTTVTVNQQDNQQLELVLQALPGSVTFNSEPEGATVSVDGVELGQTPLSNVALEAGEYTVSLQRPRYLPLEHQLLVTGREISQQVQLALAPAWADVTLNTTPPGADILVDGEVLGTTPSSVEVLQGERQLILQKPGYASWMQELEVQAGKSIELATVELQPAAGVLELTSQPSGANVTLDGEFQGQTPLQLLLTPDKEQRLTLSKPGYRRYTDTVALAAAASDSQTITLQAQLGEVRLNVSPASATIRINGQVQGQGSQTLRLPAVEQSIEVALDGHATVRRRVTPRPGLQQVVDISLKTVQAAKLARLQPELTSSLGQTLKLFNPIADGLADFTMGASRRDPGRRANEVLHPVALRRMFYLSTTEVTNAQFRLYQQAHNSGQVKGSSLNREHQPVVDVSWQQAASFCNWLSEREGLSPFYRQTKGIVVGFNPRANGYRLPTEAEWAWAARAGPESLLKFPWGERFPPALAVENYADQSSAHITGRVIPKYDDGYVVTAPVASLAPNHKGLFDMGGNVAEWVHDVYTIPTASDVAIEDPLGPQSGDNFVIRGASWAQSKLSELRLAHRDYGQAGRDDVGFRIARYAE
tara:strand:+ start:86561 stop:88639 length:2079 start_codon:yes stop_codon:yes gene_type:complete